MTRRFWRCLFRMHLWQFDTSRDLYIAAKAPGCIPVICSRCGGENKYIGAYRD